MMPFVLYEMVDKSAHTKIKKSVCLCKNCTDKRIFCVRLLDLRLLQKKIVANDI